LPTDTPRPTDTPTTPPTFTSTPMPAATCSGIGSSVAVGKNITLTCTFFQPRERVRVYWNSASSSSIASFVASTDGSGQVVVKIPKVAGGAYPVIVKGASSGRVVTLTATIKASVALSPASGRAGSRVTATFQGYKPGETITLVWFVDSSKTTVLTRTITAKADGTASYRFRVPSGAAPGGHKVEGRGSAKSRGSATFTVT
jgi:hypothetical protein